MHPRKGKIIHLDSYFFRKKGIWFNQRDGHSLRVQNLTKVEKASEHERSGEGWGEKANKDRLKCGGGTEGDTPLEWGRSIRLEKFLKEAP